MNKQIEVSEVISVGWDYAKKHGLLVAVIYLVVAIINNFLSNMFIAGDAFTIGQDLGERMARGDIEAMNQYFDLLGHASAGSIIGVIISLIVGTGLYNFALRVMTGKVQSLEFDTFNLPLNTYLKYVGTEIVVGIICMVGFICCIIPGIWLSARLGFASLHIIDNPEAGIGDAIKASWNMTSGNSLNLILLYIVFLLIVIAGFICCCVGMYFSMAITLFATVCAYLTLRPEAGAEERDMSTSNYMK